MLNGNNEAKEIKTTVVYVIGLRVLDYCNVRWLPFLLRNSSRVSLAAKTPSVLQGRLQDEVCLHSCLAQPRAAVVLVPRVE